jgi:hypothetical protein
MELQTVLWEPALAGNRPANLTKRVANRWDHDIPCECMTSTEDLGAGAESYTSEDVSMVNVKRW